MDWSRVNLFAFFPPLFSIYLLFISGLSKGYLSSQVQRAAERGAVKGHEDFVRNLASGWAAQLGFVSAMFASCFSSISVWSASQSFAGIAWTLGLLLIVFIPMIWYIFTYETDEIESVKFGLWNKFSCARLCKVVLLFVNIGLIVAITKSQQL